ncbi:MAG: zinc-dependent metalloprotease [Marmoricola sp.]
MDGVGPEVAPAVASIRNRFTVKGWARSLGAAPTAGHRPEDGAISPEAVFVRAAVDKVGMDGFNAVGGAANLPSKAEILDPKLWISRVHG